MTTTAVQPPTASSPIRWLRVILAAFLVELTLSVVFFAVGSLFNATAAVYGVPGMVVAFVVGLVVSALATRNVQSRFTLHGALIGIIATAIFFVITVLTVGIPFVVSLQGAGLFYLGQIARIAGCTAGGWVTGRTA